MASWHQTIRKPQTEVSFKSHDVQNWMVNFVCPVVPSLTCQLSLCLAHPLCRLSTTSYSVTTLVIRISVLGQCYNCSIVLVNYNQRYLSIGKNPKNVVFITMSDFKHLLSISEEILRMREALFGKNVKWKQRLPMEYQGLPRLQKLGGGLGRALLFIHCQQLISILLAL